MRGNALRADTNHEYISVCKHSIDRTRRLHARHYKQPGAILKPTNALWQRSYDSKRRPLFLQSQVLCRVKYEWGRVWTNVALLLITQIYSSDLILAHTQITGTRQYGAFFFLVSNSMKSNQRLRLSSVPKKWGTKHPPPLLLNAAQLQFPPDQISNNR